MKKFLKFPLLLLAVISLSACEDNDAPEGGETTDRDAMYEAIVSQYVDNTVIYTYKNLADYTESLVEKLKAAKSDKTDANIAAACDDFLAARSWWEKSEAFLYGPASDFGIDPHIDSWPLDLDGLLDELSNSAHIRAMEAEDADVWAGNVLGPELLGFHGIEYIIFEEGAPKSVSKITDDQLTYAIAVAGDLRNKCYQLQIAWAGEDAVASNRVDKVVNELEANVTVTGNGLSYKENMLAAGTAGCTYSSWIGAVQAIVDGCAVISDEVGLMKIGKPHTGEDVNYIESPYSQKSIVDFYDNIISIENAYMGGVSGLRDESKSVHAYIKSVNSDLDSRCVDAINNAKSKINSMKAPFVKNYTDASAGEAIEACNELTDILYEVKAQLAK